jgi:hypothetical protein
LKLPIIQKKSERICWQKVALIVCSPLLLFVPEAIADIKIEPPVSVLANKVSEGSQAKETRASSWTFQATYGLTSADVETPAWDTRTDPVTAVQKSTSGLFSENRYSHSYGISVNPRQSLRLGLSLVNCQSVSATGWMAALASKSKGPDWRSWGIGTDIFLVRHNSPRFDLDAGLNADYFVSGVATLPTSDSASAELQNASRLEQKSAWRLGFSGGIGGMYLGPLGFILRISGQVLQAQFKGHSQPLRVQGLQVQIGAGLDLGRGEP